MLNFFIGLCIAYAGGFLVTKLFVTGKDVREEEEVEIDGNAIASSVQLAAPVDGECVSLSDVKDEVFSSRMMGDGVAFRFDGDEIVAPCGGTVCMIANTKHAIGLMNEEGVEVLIHIGLDTVHLNGKGFDVLVQEGQTVKKGAPLVKLDRALLQREGVDLTTPMIVTNNGYMHVIPYPTPRTKRGETIVIQCKN